MPLLFVYGTLKRGGRNHHLMAGGRFLADAVTRPEYRVFDLGPYPGLVESPDGLAVRGELWELAAEAIPKLDAFEGADFARRPVAIAGRDELVETYFYVAPVPESRPSGSVWPQPDGAR